VYDFGQPVPLSVRTTSDGSTLADATSVVLTVTLPDGTTAEPAVGHPSIGVYTASYTPTLPGRHLVAWVAAGANAAVYSDVFNVLPADPGWIVGLAEAKAFLVGNGLGGGIVDDQRLRDFITFASATLAYFVGDVAPVTYDEWYDGSSNTIALVHTPVAAVVSVTETFGANVIRILTEQDLDGATPVDAYGYTVELGAGLVTRRVSGMAAPFADGKRNIHAVYKTGQASSMPDLIAGCLELIRYSWSQSQGAGGALGPGAPITDFKQLPNIVQNKIGKHRRLPGIG